jgi:hypothetical protein
MAATKCCVGTVHNFASSKEVLGINEQGDIWQWQGCSPKETRASFLRVRTILGHRNDECGGEDNARDDEGVSEGGKGDQNGGSGSIHVRKARSGRQINTRAAQYLRIERIIPVRAGRRTAG